MKIKNKYRYELTDRRGTLDVSPLGEADFSIDYSREDDGKYFYSQEFKGKIKFAGEIFGRLLTILESIYICTEQRLKVFRDCDPEVLIFDGYFKLTEGDWDLDRCEVVLKFEKNVADRCLQLNKSEKIDLMQSIYNRITVKTSEAGAGVFEYLSYFDYSHFTGEYGDYIWKGTGEPEDGNWTAVSTDITVSGSADAEFFNGRTEWVREIVTLDSSITAPSGYVLIEDKTAIDNTKIYARNATLINCVYNNQFMDNYNYSRSQYCTVLGDGGSSGSEIDNGLRLSDILNVFVNTFCGDLIVVSDFFQINPENPSVINYVTGEPTETAEILFFQKSDVKRPKAYGNATKATTSFDKLMDALITMFNVAYIVENGVLRIEHYSYFTRNIGLDLTDPKYKVWTNASNKFSFDNAEIPSIEKWQFKEQNFNLEAWKGEIKYNNACSIVGGRENEKNYVIDEFMSDVTLALSNPAPDSNIVGDAGFVIIASRKINDVYYIISNFVGGYIINNSLGWKSLVKKYHFHNRYLKTGLFNGEEVEFISTRPFKKGKKITIPLCCGTTFNPNDKIITSLGEAIVESATFQLKNETLEISPLFGAFDNLKNNIKPEITPANYSTYKNTELTFSVIASDPDGVVVEIIESRAPTHGSLIISGSIIKYIPETDFVGMDYIRLSARDNWSEVSDPAGFFIDVKLENQAPTAVDDFYNVYHGETFSSGAGILVNDGDDNAFELITTSATTSQGVLITLTPDGKFNYVPPTGFEGTDSFNYTIEDDAGLQSSATVFLNVAFKNKPIAVSDNYQTKKNTTLTIDGVSAGNGSVLNNDYAPDGVSYAKSATAETKSTANGGTVTITADGLFTYDPPAGFTGKDSFNYTSINPNGSAIGLVNISVLPDIYVKLIKRNDIKINHSTPCGDPPINIYGMSRKADFILKFFSDAGGTVPFNVNSLGFSVNMQIETTTTESGSTPTIEIWNTDNLTGTEFLILDEFFYREDIISCESPSITVDRAVSISAGSYNVI